MGCPQRMDVSHRLSQRVGLFLKERGLILATAESCTGGWLAEVVTSIPGSSAWFDRGFITYSNDAKQDMLDVDQALLDDVGAVSEEVVRAMAGGALSHANADIAVAITGIAGPDGGTPQKPVGSVWLAWAVKGQPIISRFTHFVGDREMVRQQAVMAALQGIVDVLSTDSEDSQSKVG